MADAKKSNRPRAVVYALAGGMGVIIGRGPTLDRAGAIYGPLVILNDVHRQVAERFETILENERVEPGS